MGNPLQNGGILFEERRSRTLKRDCRYVNGTFVGDGSDF